ncbi:hypothetical protein EEL31_12900 [Brevibacillus laterosporus]|nr:hypothetical protein EEL31_12900 [Brevibacillus laterosporus]
MQRTTRTTPNQTNRSKPAQTNSTVSGQTRGASGNNTIICRKCKSAQIVANKRGYSFSTMFKTLAWMVLLPLFIIVIGIFITNYYLMYATSSAFFLDDLITFFGIICNISLVLSIPVSILVGFVGRSENRLKLATTLPRESCYKRIYRCI